ncbi:flagellar export chaperone FliS [Lignipirellula cremea]|uniref:Flagellar protein FliS n=1 Tax=Lignipirellula cremea TaxID=2528010 RepID=A0A518DSM0_9BACT|nr:flagellar export chaperone FliS [Lignipirellula cremea]QDU94835.1 Flagellar protein FliS [Lignipirellula cremea]
MQNDHARNVYLETQINTATPQKLRLMLIGGAIRFARQTMEHWRNEEPEQAFEALIRSRSIVSELLATIRPSSGPLERTMAAIYAYIFQTMTLAQMERSEEKLLATIQVLEEEQATWLALCEKYPHETPPSLRAEEVEITAKDYAADNESKSTTAENEPAARFSIDA